MSSLLAALKTAEDIVFNQYVHQMSLGCFVVVQQRPYG
jgi:hypothetical protein